MLRAKGHRVNPNLIATGAVYSSSPPLSYLSALSFWSLANGTGVNRDEAKKTAKSSWPLRGEIRGSLESPSSHHARADSQDEHKNNQANGQQDEESCYPKISSQ